MNRQEVLFSPAGVQIIQTMALNVARRAYVIVVVIFIVIVVVIRRRCTLRGFGCCN